MRNRGGGDPPNLIVKLSKQKLQMYVPTLYQINKTFLIYTTVFIAFKKGSCPTLYQNQTTIYELIVYLTLQKQNHVNPAP